MRANPHSSSRTAGVEQAHIVELAHIIPSEHNAPSFGVRIKHHRRGARRSGCAATAAFQPLALVTWNHRPELVELPI